MNKTKLILALDQGTTSSRAIVFDLQGNIVSLAQQEFKQYYPNNGWVEHDAEEIWSSTLNVARQAFTEAEKKGGEVVTIGITNQRETTILWQRDNAKPIHKAIVWQDRRTSDLCQALKQQGHESLVQKRAGLLLDPYFSATKVAYILDHVEGARDQADEGKLAFGTVDSFLLYRLSAGKVHATDATNAARTSLCNIHTGQWDPDLLALFNVPETILPEIKDCAADFGVCDKSIFGREIPICGMAGDQQAATIGQCCFAAGETKSTYGTGCFALMNTGEKAVSSTKQLLTTVAYQLNGKRTYALEGSIFIAGAAVQWLRDEMQLIQHASETEALARSVPDNAGVYLVPAFTGLGAPYWQPEARGALVGLTRASNRANIVRAALEAVCYQSYDLLSAMSADACLPTALRVDGGMVENPWLLQFLADILDLRVERPLVAETTALGAAFLAGLQCGLYNDLNELKTTWQCQSQYNPNMPESRRAANIAGWQKAVRQVLAQ